MLARIIEPVSMLDSLQILEEAGVAAASSSTPRRRLPAYAKGQAVGSGVAGACC